MIAIGIDLGTTNTVSAIGGQVFEHPEGVDEGPLLASAVAFLPGGHRLVGAAARRRYPIDPLNTVISAKRLIGRRWGSDDIEHFRSRYPFQLVEQDGHAAFVTRAGTVNPIEIGATVIARKLSDAGLAGGALRSVIAVPSMFGAPERDATARAATMAGLTNPTVIDEPIATATTYLQAERVRPGRCLVYDLGGGTFDLALVDCSVHPYRVLARSGDLYLGGDDLDRLLADHVARLVLERERWDLKDGREVFARLVSACEKVKVRLCYSSDVTVDVRQVDPAAHLREPVITISQQDLARVALELIQRTFVVCDELLHRAGVKPSQVDEIFLAGGTTQLDLVRSSLVQYFGREPRCDYDPMEVIGIGASLIAEQP